MIHSIRESGENFRKNWVYLKMQLITICHDRMVIKVVVKWVAWRDGDRDFWKIVFNIFYAQWWLQGMWAQPGWTVVALPLKSYILTVVLKSYNTNITLVWKVKKILKSMKRLGVSDNYSSPLLSQLSPPFGSDHRSKGQTDTLYDPWVGQEKNNQKFGWPYVEMTEDKIKGNICYYYYYYYMPNDCSPLTQTLLLEVANIWINSDVFRYMRCISLKLNPVLSYNMFIDTYKFTSFFF